ncbi:MAG: dephospho-CoA kinase [Rhodoferax sp.]|nr:dephospho-CoA kinase [Rhodoferax sp.]
MHKLGLTGGIGSGKSTVANLLAQSGAKVIDADAISRATTAPGGAAIALIAQQFGPEYVDASGALRREPMRQRVFNDAAAKKQLEAIIHPLVGQAIAEYTRQALAQGTRCLVYDIPLLVESGHWRKHLDRVLVLDCHPAIQLERVCQRSALSRENVMKIIAAQASRPQRLAAADWVLHNQGISLTQLALQVQEIAMQFGLSSM